MILRGLVTAFLLVAGITAVAAQNYPSKPIKVIVPFGAGAAGDTTTRIVLDQVGRDTGASFVIENRPGALGMLGTAALLNSAADGYTIMMSGTSTHSLASALSKSATYDPINDFSHILLMTYFPMTVLVRNASKYDSINALIQDVKANPGKVTYGFAAGSQKIFGVKFHSQLALDSRPVPYKSSQTLLTDMLGGQVDYILITTAEALGLVNGGQARALVILGDERSTLLPNVPSLKELGLPSIQLTAWTGFAGPAGMPAEAKQWIAKSVGAALENPQTLQKLKNSTVEVIKPVAIDQWVRVQLQSWTAAAKEAGVEPE